MLDDYAPPGFEEDVATGVPFPARAFFASAVDDPFAKREAVDACLSQLSRAGCAWQLQLFGGAGTLHAFTNPAQAINAHHDKFGYDKHAADASWAAGAAFLTDIFA